MPRRASVSTPRESPRSAVRILQILARLSERPTGWTLSTLSREMDTPKSSLLVLLRALHTIGYISQTDGIYRLDSECFRLASQILANRHFPEVARSILQQVVEETGETAVIGTLSEDGQSSVYIDKVESASALRFSAKIGDRRPLYSSASGHIMLAFGPPQATESYIKDVKLSPLTGSTITTKQELKKAIAEVRENGVAVTRDQATSGVTGFGAPIYDETGQLIASLVLAAPSARVEAKIAETSELARQAANAISRTMGYSAKD